MDDQEYVLLREIAELARRVMADELRKDGWLAGEKLELQHLLNRFFLPTGIPELDK